jgi:hypothetical protein
MERLASDNPHKLAQLAKCAHEGCVCTVAEGEQFCSDYCAAQAGSHEAAAAHGECGCGHAECTAATTQELEPVVVGTS